MSARQELRRQFEQLPPEMGELLNLAEEEIWNDGFGSAKEAIMSLHKRLKVLELLCSGAAWRGQDEKFHQRWQWYRSLPPVGGIPDEAIQELRRETNG